MAKAGFWLKGSVGKLAGAVAQKGADGETILRERVIPKNPKTEAQNIQRIIMNTVAQSYSKMRDIVDHSFEGVTPGAKTMSKYMQRNLNILRQKLASDIADNKPLSQCFAYAPVGSKDIVPNGYQVSEGSLPQIEIDITGQATLVMPLTENNYQSLINDYDLKRGDQITFVALTGVGSATARFRWFRLIIDPQEGGVSMGMDTELASVDVVNAGSPRNAGSYQTFSYDDGAINVVLDDNPVICAAVIVSRKASGDKWLRSTAYMKQNPDWGQWASSNSMQYCLDQIQQGDVPVESARILNNAGTGVVTRGASSQYVLKDNTGASHTLVNSVVTTIGGVAGVYFTDTAGNRLLLRSTDSRSRTYNNFLKAKSGATVAAAWSEIDPVPATYLVMPEDIDDATVKANFATSMQSNFGINFSVWYAQ